MFTKYMFNQLSYNPAYAGSYDFMSIAAIHRQQWWGIDGAPITQSFTIHTPLPILDNKVGVGLSVINDKIGPTGSTNINLSYAYHIHFSPEHKLSFALQGGVMNWRADFNKLDIRDPDDVAYQDSDMTPNMWFPNFGAGVYYYSTHFYVGASVPHILNQDLRDADTTPDIVKNAQLYRHYYFMAGGMVPVTSDIKFKPSLLIKNVGLFGEFDSDPSSPNYAGAPTEFDVDLSLFFFETLWVGTSFRSSFEAFDGRSSVDSADIWAAYFLRNGLRIGIAYDFTLTKLRDAAKGSFDVMLGYDFDYKEKKIVTPRYF